MKTCDVCDSRVEHLHDINEHTFGDSKVCDVCYRMHSINSTSTQNLATATNLILQEIRSQSNVPAALDLVWRFGRIDGGHHKTWVIDQMCRALLGPKYDDFVKDACDGEDGPETYDWDTGIAP